MGKEVGSSDKRFTAAREASYDSPYRRLIAGSLRTFSSISRVKDDDLGSSLGAAMESTVTQTIEAMGVSDEHMATLEENLSKLRLKTSDRLHSFRKIDEVLKDVLGDDIVRSADVEALISIINNKYSNFIKVEEGLAKSTSKLYSKQLLAHQGHVDGITEEVVSDTSAKKTIYQNSIARRFSKFTDSTSDSVFDFIGGGTEVKKAVVRCILGFGILTGYKVGSVLRGNK